MPIRRRGNALEIWEIALIKAMAVDGRWTNDQDILAYFTRPTRSVNHRAISEIKNGSKHNSINPANALDLEVFLENWPNLDQETGLNLRGDELIIKAREAMIAAVLTFNSGGLNFRSELFIVTSIIAWTYLLHAWLKREGIDYRYMKKIDGMRQVVKTPNGEDKFWDLSACLSHQKCPLEGPVIDNLNFLISLRHEIEHRSTDRIDEHISAQLQSCCLNFNHVLKTQFGQRYGLEHRLPIALQFVSFSLDQQSILKKAKEIPRHIQTMIDGFNNGLSEEQFNDPRFAYRLYLVPKTVNRSGGADLAVQLVDPKSEIAEKFAIALREVEKKKYRAKDVINTIKAAGFGKFN